MQTYVITGSLLEEFKEFLEHKHRNAFFVDSWDKLVRIIPLGIVSKIKRVVANNCGLDPDALVKKCNKPLFSTNRGIAMYFMRKVAGMSYPAIGKSFGGMHHTTVIYWIERIEEKRKADRSFGYEVRCMELEITGEDELAAD